MTLSELVAKVEGRMDGPHADEDTAAAAWLAAESVRYLNYASGSHSPTGMEFPATVCLVAGNLSIAASRMPQLFDQLRHWLGEQLRAGMLGTDDGTPVDPAITAACLRPPGAPAGSPPASPRCRTTWHTSTATARTAPGRRWPHDHDV